MPGNQQEGAIITETVSTPFHPGLYPATVGGRAGPQSGKVSVTLNLGLLLTTLVTQLFCMPGVLSSGNISLSKASQLVSPAAG